jgi:predicted DNA-binding transcriptional regulator AlpA
MMARKIISRLEFRRRLGDISRATEYRLRQADPSFPKVVSVSRGRTGIDEDESDAYIARLVDTRDCEAEGRTAGANQEA